MISEENQKKLTDAVKANMFSAKNLTLNEAAIAAFKNSGVSMENFKVRQDLVEKLSGKPYYNKNLDLVYESDFTQVEKVFDELMRIHLRERLKKMSEQAVEKFHQAMASLPDSKVLPITMEIDGVTTKVGEALIDPTEKGFAIMHAIIDGQENVLKLLGTDLSQISIGNKEDFKKGS